MRPFLGLVCSCWLLSLLVFGCTPDGAAAEVSAEDLGPNASIIRMPVNETAELDSARAARMVFETERFDFGTVSPGTVVEHRFEFVNSGTVPLLIGDASSSCGCTVADYPREPLPPGATGFIDVRFDTENKSGRQNKSVSLKANTFPSDTYLYVSGLVQEQ